MLGNNSDSQALMQALNQIFQMEYTSKIHAELMETLSQNFTLENMIWAFVTKENTAELIYEITMANKVSTTTDLFYIEGSINNFLNGIVKEWAILEFLVDQQLVEDYENDYFIDFCASEN
jgi:hypothetical protein